MDGRQVAAWAARFALVVLAVFVLSLFFSVTGYVVTGAISLAVLVGLVWLAVPRRSTPSLTQGEHRG